MKQLPWSNITKFKAFCIYFVFMSIFETLVVFQPSNSKHRNFHFTVVANVIGLKEILNILQF